MVEMRLSMCMFEFVGDGGDETQAELGETET